VNSTKFGHFIVQQQHYVAHPQQTRGRGCFHVGGGLVSAQHGDQRSYGYRNNILIYRGVNTRCKTIAAGQLPAQSGRLHPQFWFPTRYSSGPRTGTSAYATPATTCRRPTRSSAAAPSVTTRQHHGEQSWTVPVVSASIPHRSADRLYTPALHRHDAEEFRRRAVRAPGYSRSALRCGSRGRNHGHRPGMLTVMLSGVTLVLPLKTGWSPAGCCGPP